MLNLTLDVLVGTCVHLINKEAGLYDEIIERGAKERPTQLQRPWPLSQ